MKPRLLRISGWTDRMRAHLEAAFEVEPLPKDLDAWLDEEGPKIEAVLTDGHLGVDPDLMARLSGLKVVSCYGVGYDNIDAVAAAERGVMVTHTPGVLDAEVSSTAIMLALACHRKLLEMDAHVRSGGWERDGNLPLTRALDGRTVGILGMGRIGQAIGAKFAAFGCPILYHTRSPKDVPYTYAGDLAEMAAKADVLVVITPGGAATKHLVNAAVLEALGPEGVLINVARGSVVDEAALIAALEAGTIMAAGLDVFEDEPRVPEALRASPRALLLPHVGSATVETRQAMGDLAVANLTEFFETGTVRTPVPECSGL